MRSTTLLITALLLALAAHPAWSEKGPRGKGGDRRNVGEARGTTAAEAAQSARRQTGGRVLDVRESAEGFRVKVLTPDGEIRSILIPGRR
jgi:hypothetical protein